jgi:hypothetical protein
MISNLSKSELVDLLKSESVAKGEDQEMFLDGFAMYLKHDPRKDFVVDLDDVYECLGFSRKNDLKKVVLKRLEERVLRRRVARPDGSHRLRSLFFIFGLMEQYKRALPFDLTNAEKASSRRILPF